MDETAMKAVLHMIPYGLYVLGAGQGDGLEFIGEVTEAVLHGEAEALTLKEIGANYGG